MYLVFGIFGIPCLFTMNELMHSKFGYGALTD